MVGAGLQQLLQVPGVLRAPHVEPASEVWAHQGHRSEEFRLVATHEARVALSGSRHLSEASRPSAASMPWERRSIPCETTTWLPLDEFDCRRAVTRQDRVAKHGAFADGTIRFWDDLLELIEPFGPALGVRYKLPDSLPRPLDLDGDLHVDRCRKHNASTLMEFGRQHCRVPETLGGRAEAGLRMISLDQRDCRPFVTHPPHF